MTTSATQLAVVHDAATRTDLEDWGPLEGATGPEMRTSGLTLWEAGDASSGIWECPAGPSRWTLETQEFVHLLTGRMTVTPDGAEPVELVAGDTMVFPLGWSGTWDITETLRKVYVIY